MKFLKSVQCRTDKSSVSGLYKGRIVLMNVVKKIMCGVVALIALACLIGCGTTKGVLTGLEATGGGIIQDLKGAVDGIDRADEAERR